MWVGLSWAWNCCWEKGKREGGKPKASKEGCRCTQFWTRGQEQSFGLEPGDNRPDLNSCRSRRCLPRMRFLFCEPSWVVEMVSQFFYAGYIYLLKLFPTSPLFGSPSCSISGFLPKNTPHPGSANAGLDLKQKVSQGGGCLSGRSHIKNLSRR